MKKLLLILLLFNIMKISFTCNWISSPSFNFNLLWRLSKILKTPEFLAPNSKLVLDPISVLFDSYKEFVNLDKLVGVVGVGVETVLSFVLELSWVWNWFCFIWFCNSLSLVYSFNNVWNFLESFSVLTFSISSWLSKNFY